jgi:hypothetical protein
MPRGRPRKRQYDDTERLLQADENPAEPEGAPAEDAPSGAPIQEPGVEPAEEQNEPEAPAEPSKSADGRLRVVCNRPNAGSVINGRLFAPVEIEGEQMHVSELLPPADAERFASIPGYALFDRDENLHARRIEDALEVARQTKAAMTDRGSARIRDLQRELAEQQRANQSLTERLQAERARGDRLEGESKKLRKENAAYKAAGIQPSQAAA